jgi:hypothetical protein
MFAMESKPCQGLFSVAQDVWVEGKELPILDGILNAIEATAHHVISGALHLDQRSHISRL